MRWFARFAWLPSGLARDVRFEVSDGRFTSVTADSVPAGASVLPGVVLPGLANCHSHAFHRALRGRTHDRGGSFWTWREQMYAVAEQLDPDSYHRLARAVFSEMAGAGITCVGEFHYLHHASDGRRYDDPNAMGAALVAAARDAGIRITLLDTCYLSAGVGGEALTGVQRRFGDGDVTAWAERVGALRDEPGARHGVAAHSVRAVPRPALSVVAAVADGRPLHAHVSEQPAENDACLTEYGVTPTMVLAEAGVLGPATTAVHAVHVTENDIAAFASTGTTVCVCPSTEHDLADGVAPSRAYADAGVALSLGSDQHAVVDMFRETQLLEGDQRAISLQRGRFAPAQLVDAMTAHASLGWPDAGRLETGARADLVAVRTDTMRTAGSDPGQIPLVASAADVDTVIVDGVEVVRDGAHRIGQVGALLAEAIAEVTT